MLLTATRQKPFAGGSVANFLRGHPFQVPNLDRSEKVRSHQKNPKYRLAQKCVGLTTLVLLALSFGPQPAAAKQKSAAEVAKSKSADGLAPVKEALTKVVAAHFQEGLNGKKTKRFFEGWTDADWERFLKKTPRFYTEASNLKAGDPDLDQLQQELYKKHSNQITGAIAETFHWVRWRKKIEQIAKDEKYTDVEFLDEKTLSKIFTNNGGKRCDGLAIAKDNGNPPKRVILGVFESKVDARLVEPKQIKEFVVRIREHYKVSQEVSLIRLNQGQTKPLQNIDDSDSAIIIEAAREFHKEAAQFLNGEDSIHFLLNIVSVNFASNVMRQAPEQKQMLFEETLPLKKLADFIRDKKRFPIYGKEASEDEKTLANWVYEYFEENRDVILAYLRGRGGVDEDKLKWALEVKADLWKKQLPEFAEFINETGLFPTQGTEASDDEKKLAQWVNSHFKGEKEKKILAYLRGLGRVDEATLQRALNTRDRRFPWQNYLPEFADFIRDKKRFPIYGTEASDDEKKLAQWINSHFKGEKETEILAYLRGPGRVDEATLSWALEVKANPWKSHLPELAEFINENGLFPTQGTEASDDEKKLAGWLTKSFRKDRKAILAYLRGPGRVDEDTLQRALDTRDTPIPWRSYLPEFAEFINETGLFPTQGTKASNEEKKLAIWVNSTFKGEKETEILAYLRGPGRVDEAKLQFALEARVNLWKRRLPELAKFINEQRQFPTKGTDEKPASKYEYSLARWYGRHKKDTALLDYLRDHQIKIPATGAPAGLGECSEVELQGILRELAPAA